MTKIVDYIDTDDIGNLDNSPTIADKIYETMSRNQAKLDRTRKL